MTQIPVPGGPSRISPEKRQTYIDKGYLVLRGVFHSDEVATWRSELERLLRLDLVHKNNLRTRFRQIASGEWQIERFDPIIDISALFAAIAKNERILTSLQCLLDEDVLLCKDKLIFKFPYMSGYKLHQDYAWWQAITEPSLVSVMIAVDGANKNNGALELFPNYHHCLYSIAGAQRDINAEEMRQIDLSSGELVETEPGDIIIFHCLTPHQSGINVSNQRRAQLYFTYSPTRLGDLYKEHYSDYYERYVIKRLSDKVKEETFFR